MTDRYDENLDRENEEIIPEPVADVEGDDPDIAVAATPQHPGVAAVVPDDDGAFTAEGTLGGASEDGVPEDTAGEPLDPEQREALGEHKPFD
ncbi:MAG: hypothetical protein Q4G64_09735 [bacterium]|nr:hypothetical protein [bacterium]